MWSIMFGTIVRGICISPSNGVDGCSFGTPMHTALILVVCASWLVGVWSLPVVLVVPADASGHELIGAYEIRRYLYAITGYYSLIERSDVVGHADAQAVVIARSDKKLLAQEKISFVAMDDHLIRMSEHEGSGTLYICTGASDRSTLYSAYRFIERALGVGFRLHGDVIPNKRNDKTFDLPSNMDELHFSAVFSNRGIQPFHDFPEGPDWWGRNEYKHVLTQANKLQLNFIGLHTYPLTEPLVWVGVEGDFDPIDGTVSKSYPATWESSLRTDWFGFFPVNTSQYYFGSNMLYKSDCFNGADDVLADGACPWPTTMEQSNLVFNRAAALINESFTYARALGIQTCVGTETPLAMPDTSIPSQQYYEGIFKRVMAAYPIDYYWVWTSEGWEWLQFNMSDPVVQAAMADLLAAQSALVASNATFKLATCGWVLGPLGERAYLDTFLNNEWAFLSALDQDVGNNITDPSFAQITHHNKWTIPWMEDDPGLTSAQLWVNRTLLHAQTALSYGVEGMLGIHWRTRAIAPQLSALSQVAWNISLNSIDFWRSYCAVEFGSVAVGDAAAAIFSSVDSFALPRPVGWISGPGNLIPDFLSWSARSPSYAFVDDFAALRSQISDPTSLANFDYWLNTFEYVRSIAQMSCAWGEFVGATEAIYARSANYADLAQFADELIPSLLPVLTNASAVINSFYPLIGSIGELGTLSNLQGHSFPQAIDGNVMEIAALKGYIGCFVDNATRDLNGATFTQPINSPGTCFAFCYNQGYRYAAVQDGTACFCGNAYGTYGETSYTECNMPCTPMPKVMCGGPWRNSVYDTSAASVATALLPTKEYTGVPQLFVPTPRTALSQNELYNLTVMLLVPSAYASAVTVQAFARPLNSSIGFQVLDFALVTEGRQVYTLTFPSTLTASDFEYFVVANVPDAPENSYLIWPPSGTDQPHTVIILPF